MKKIRGYIVPLSLILLIPIINIIYVYLNNSSHGIHSLVTDIDKEVPFIKAFAVPYILWSPFLIGTLIYLCIRYRETYYKVIISIVVGLSLCFTIYYFFQTTVPRPQLYGNDFFTSLVKYIYNSDNPFNCFPSIHVLTSYILIKGINNKKNKWKADKVIVTAAAVLIILSTQFIKQHVILDMIFAILIGNAIYWTVDNFNIDWIAPFIRKNLVFIDRKKKVQAR